jgi:hypothetical protein
MAVKTVDIPSLDRDVRLVFLREIAGIVLALMALLMFLGLLSDRFGMAWIGPFGTGLANRLDWVFGQSVSFVLPVMIGLLSFELLRGISPGFLSRRSLMRGLGGLTMIIAFCSILTLTGSNSEQGDLTRSFRWGGLIGSMIMLPDGLNLSGLLGPVGSWVVFGGLALIGLVLFTEKLVRDLATFGWNGVRRNIQNLFRLKWIAWMHGLMPSKWMGTIMHAWHYLVDFFTWGRWSRFIDSLSFRERDRGSQVMGAAPIVELVPGELTAPSPSAPHGLGGARFEPDDEPDEIRLDESRGPNGEMVKLVNCGFESDRPAVEKKMEQGFVLDRHKPDNMPVQDDLNLFPSEYQLPSIDLLKNPPDTLYQMSDHECEVLSRKIEDTLNTFKVEVEVMDVIQGPVITRFALRVAPGVRVNKILALESELAMALKAQNVRILAPIPGQSAVGIEVPNRKANPVMLRELLEGDDFRDSRASLTFALGKNIAGESVICDLAKMPHLLIAGATGSGKSVCLNTIIASFLFKNGPDDVKFVMIDPKRVELSIYQAIPHLLAPVVCDTRKASGALAWCVEQMEERYRILAELGVRNLDSYNRLLRDPDKKAIGHEMKFMPRIVIIIDELADLMMVAKNEIEEYIIRLAQMARAVGMHLVLATQRPSVNVITGIIKANFPSRIAFQVSSKVDSRTILDMNGAEALLGRGDMLYSPGGAKPFRIQGAFVSDSEVEKLSDYIREQERASYAKDDFEVIPTQSERARANLEMADPELMDDEGGPPDRLAVRGRAGATPRAPSDIDQLTDEELYDMALQLICESRKASVSYIQRRMRIGYARAGRIMDMLEEQGIVGPYQGSKPRDLLVDPAQYLAETGQL